MKTLLIATFRSITSFLSSRKFLYVSFFFIIFLFRCKPVDEQVLKIKKGPFEVSLYDAIQVASKYDLTSNKSIDSKKARIVTNTDVDKKETIVDENKTPLFHVLNYAKGGFIIISADLRTIPVLAFADKGSFETKEIPDGVRQWFDESKDKIKVIKKDNKDADPVIVKAWKEYLKEELNLPTKKGGRVSNTNCYEWYTTGQFMCHTSTNTYGPFVNTNWGQGGYSTGYLNACPNANFCNRYNAGCGPVALAQIMRYYQKPGWFSYAGIPNNSSRYDCNPSTPDQWELARLMIYCGSASGLNSIYGFAGTTNTFSYPWNIPNALSNYGYSGNGSSSDLNMNVVRNEIMSGFPVILWGTSGSITNFENYHIWICDGLYKINYSEYNCDTHDCNTSSFEYYDMNWGWHGDFNGWYSVGNFTPNGTNYNTFMHMIAGIRP